jgi:hypothetical protein
MAPISACHSVSQVLLEPWLIAISASFFFLSNVRNFISQNKTKLETNESEYTGMYIKRLGEQTPFNKV